MNVLGSSCWAVERKQQQGTAFVNEFFWGRAVKRALLFIFGPFSLDGKGGQNKRALQQLTFLGFLLVGRVEQSKRARQ